MPLSQRPEGASAIADRYPLEIGTATYPPRIAVVLHCGYATIARIVATGAGASERCPSASQGKVVEGSIHD